MSSSVNIAKIAPCASIVYQLLVFLYLSGIGQVSLHWRLVRTLPRAWPTSGGTWEEGRSTHHHGSSNHQCQWSVMIIDIENGEDDNNVNYSKVASLRRESKAKNWSKPGPTLWNTKTQTDCKGTMCGRSSRLPFGSTGAGGDDSVSWAVVFMMIKKLVLQ